MVGVCFAWATSLPWNLGGGRRRVRAGCGDRGCGRGGGRVGGARVFVVAVAAATATATGDGRSRETFTAAGGDRLSPLVPVRVVLVKHQTLDLVPGDWFAFPPMEPGFAVRACRQIYMYTYVNIREVWGGCASLRNSSALAARNSETASDTASDTVDRYLQRVPRQWVYRE